MTIKTEILGLICAVGLAAQTTTGSGTSAESGSGAAAAFPTNVSAGMWTMIQHKMFATSGSTGSGSCASGTATCTVNVSAIGAGHLLVCIPHGTSVSGVNACSGDGDTWTAECCLSMNGALVADLQWVLSSNGGGTSITCNFASTSTYKECGLREYALSNGSPVSDSGGGFSATCSPFCLGESLTIGGSNEVIIQSIFANTGTMTISGPYGNLDVSSSGGGNADSLNTTDGTAPQWTLTSNGTAAGNAVSFMTSFGLLAPRPPTVTGPGPRARAPARRAARRRRRRRNEREEKRDDRDERRDDRK